MGSRKETVGKKAYELLSKSPERINVIDMQREMQKSFFDNMQDIVRKHKTYADRYYILVILRRERLIPNAIRQQFVVRKSRPEPFYDSTLYSYSNKTGDLTYCWSIPDQDTCEYLLRPDTNLSKEYDQLKNFVKKFADGTLV